MNKLIIIIIMIKSNLRRMHTHTHQRLINSTIKCENYVNCVRICNAIIINMDKIIIVIITVITIMIIKNPNKLLNEINEQSHAK